MEQKITANERLRTELNAVKKEAKEAAKKISLNIPKLKDCKYHLEDKEKERETQKMQQSVTENTNEIYEREQNRLLTAIQTQRRKEDEEDKRKLSADEVANYMIGK